jgi:hypothetical protein
MLTGRVLGEFAGILLLVILLLVVTLMRALAKVVEGTPQLETYEVCNSTIEQICARA